MTPDPVADAIQALIRAQKRNGHHDTQWTPIAPGQCCLCGRVGRQTIVANQPQQLPRDAALAAPEKGVHMAEFLARQLGEAPVIDCSVLGHAAWMLRDLLDRENRTLNIRQHQISRWRVHA